jgi:hypothetical protein
VILLLGGDKKEGVGVSDELDRFDFFRWLGFRRFLKSRRRFFSSARSRVSFTSSRKFMINLFLCFGFVFQALDYFFDVF